MSSKKTLIIFDLIATLVDAGPRYAKAFADMCVAYGYPAPDEEEILSMLGEKSLKEITAHYMGALEDAEAVDFMTECNDSCDALLHDAQWVEHVYDGMKDTVKALYDKGYALGIYTGTREDALQAQLSYHGLEAYFVADYIRGKDNQRDKVYSSKEIKTRQLGSIVKSFKEQHGADVDIIVVGDSLSDAQAAQALGLEFIAFAETKKKEQTFVSLGIKAFFRQFSDLPALISGRKCPKTDHQSRPNQGPRI